MIFFSSTDFSVMTINLYLSFMEPSGASLKFCPWLFPFDPVILTPFYLWASQGPETYCG